MLMGMRLLITIERRSTAMGEHELLSDSIYEERTHLAERELSAFIGSVTELFGPEQAQTAAEDWLEEAGLMDSPPVSTERDWRSVTIAASARLAGRTNAAQHRRESFSASTETKGVANTIDQLLRLHTSDVIMTIAIASFASSGKRILKVRN
jgi:hypothetical protein